MPAVVGRVRPGQSRPRHRAARSQDRRRPPLPGGRNVNLRKFRRPHRPTNNVETASPRRRARAPGRRRRSDHFPQLRVARLPEDIGGGRRRQVSQGVAGVAISKTIKRDQAVPSSRLSRQTLRRPSGLLARVSPTTAVGRGHQGRAPRSAVRKNRILDGHVFLTDSRPRRDMSEPVSTQSGKRGQVT